MGTLSVVIRIQKDKNEKGQYVAREKGNVYVMYTHNSKPTYFSTGVSVEPKYFQKKLGQWVKSGHPGHQSKNRTIKDKYDSLDKLIAKFDGIPESSDIKEALSGKNKSKSASDMTFTALYTEYLLNLPDRRQSTLVAKNSALLHWKEFAKRKPYKVKELNPIIYDKLRAFLLKKFAASTVSKTIKDVKACLNWANERGYLGAEVLGAINLALWKVKKQKPQNIHYLEMSELQQVIDFKPKSNYLNKTKDLLILQAHTGLRISDLKTITRSGDVIRMKAKKTGETIQVPLTGMAKNILEKHGDRPPKISDQKFNEYMKVLLMKAGIDRKADMPAYQFEKLNETRKERVKLWQKETGYFALKDAKNVPVPFYELASSHALVRTFITVAAELGMTPKTIATITGKTVKVILDNYLGTSEKTLTREMNVFDKAFNQNVG